jgi:hypothetical protein
MTALPVWFWSLLGGLALGPIGLAILWPACSQGALALMKRLVITILVKLALAGIGLYLAIKQLQLPVNELVLGFFAGYLLSLILEISLCLWKVRKCARDVGSLSP